MPGEVVHIEAYPKPPLAVTIPKGNTISVAFDTEGYNIVGLLIPDSWDGGATISFLVAEKGEPETSWPPSPSEQAAARYRPLVYATTNTAITAPVADVAGNLVTVFAAAGKMIALSDVIQLRGMRYIKIVAAQAVAADRVVQALRVQYVQ